MKILFSVLERKKINNKENTPYNKKSASLFK